MAGLLDRDHLPNNILAQIQDLRRRLDDLERAAALGLFPGGGDVLTLPAGVTMTLPTEDLVIVDAGTAAATEQAWIEGTVDGVTGYLRVFAAK